MKISTISIGNVFHSLALYVDEFPKYDSESSVSKCFTKVGGAAVVAACVAHLEGASSNLATLCPHDIDMDTLIQRLRRGGVDVSLVKRHQREANRFFSVYSPDYRRICFTYSPSPIDTSHYSSSDFLDFDVAFLCCIPYKLVREIINLLPSSCVKVLVPSGLCPDYFDDNTLLVPCDFLFLNAGEFKGITGAKTIDDAYECICLPNITNLVVTSGSQGVYLGKDLTNIEHWIPDGPVEIRHAGGAGDAFAVAYVLHYLSEPNHDLCCPTAHKAATTLLGIVDPIELLEGTK